ncbi:3'(2'),5'-bisphosphate nucleotidase CysQ family protein [Megalodesulfovibrio paquesii]
MPSNPLLDPASVLPALQEIGRTAGQLVASHYGKPLAQWTKPDNSPVTEADTASHACIAAFLAREFPGVPVLSEEGEDIPYAQRCDWTQFFLVDPLDGTKGFLRRNGDFCVAIALVQHGRSTAGCIHIPTEDVLYAGGPGLGSRMQVPGRALEIIRTRKPAPGEGLTVLCSQSRETPKLDAFLLNKPVARRFCRGGAVKFCLLAKGEAHLFPCLYPTYEWDAAAGQAIVEGAGGTVQDLQGRPIRYNKENLINLPFVAEA